MADGDFTGSCPKPAGYPPIFVPAPEPNYNWAEKIAEMVEFERQNPGAMAKWCATSPTKNIRKRRDNG